VRHGGIDGPPAVGETNGVPVTEETYERVALEDFGGQWELLRGRLRSKPGMTVEHNDAVTMLAFFLQRQIPIDDVTVGTNSARTRTPKGDYLVPDLVALPRAMSVRLKGSERLETYGEPLPLVVEVWSPTTEDYNVTEKFAYYRTRGDAEIWLIHPYERTLVAWVRQPDGSYSETRYAGGEVRPAALPGVVIQLESLFR
jgi:Uma2 family endonuclease